MPKVQITLEVADSGATAKLKDYGRAAADAFAAVKAGDPALKSATLRVQELTTAKGKATTVANEWTGALQLIPGPLGQITSQAQVLTSALAGPGGLAVGIGAVVAAGFLLTKSLANDIERLDNLSRQTGLSVASLQAFEEAAKRAGESPETLTQGLGKVNAAISDVLMGTANAGKAFQAIGVDLRGMVRDGASAEDILEATAKALAAIEDPTRRAAAQMELFGIRGRAMSTVLDSLAEKGLRGYTAEMEKAGVVTSAETNKMARAFDTMFDDVLTRARGFWVQMKAFSAEWILNTRSDLDAFTTKMTAALLMTTAAIMQFRASIGITSQADADAASRSAKAALEMLMAASRAAAAGPPAVERPPPQDLRRVLAPTAEEIKATEDAIKKALGLENATRQLNDQWKEGLELGQKYTEILNKLEFDTLNEESKKAEKSLKEYDISLTQTTDDILENNRAIDGSVGFFQAWGEEVENVDGILVNVKSTLQGLPPSLMAVRTDADLAFIHMRDVVAGAEGSVERLAHQIKTEMPSAFEQFQEGFAKTSEDLAARFQDWGRIGSETAVVLHTAFSDFGVALVQNFDNIGDAWQGLLDSMIRMIIDFLASAAVKELLSLGTDLIDSLRSSSTSTSTGSSNFDIFSPSTWFAQQKAMTEESGKRLSLEQSRTDESTQQLRLEEAKTTAGKVAGAVGGVLGGVLGGGLGGAAAGPVGAALGAIAGAAGLRAAFENLTDKLVGMISPTNATAAAALAASQEQVTAMHAFDRNTVTTGDLTAATQSAAQASRDLAATQTDLAISQADLTSSTTGLTDSTQSATEATDTTSEGLTGFADSVTGLGESVGAAAEAAGAAAEVAGAAAASANASAERAASAAAEAGDRNPGFGPGSDFQGGGRGSPDPTGPNSPSFGGEPSSSSGGGGFSNSFQSGLFEGPVRRSGFARVHRGEVVATPNQAAALLRALQGGMRGETGSQIVALLVRQNQILQDGLSRRRPAGAVV